MSASASSRPDASDVLVTVVVAVYNTAPYLDACMAGILGQTHRRLEVILVEDGSTDGSAQMCEGYAAADPRVVLVSEGHGGLSRSRNLALDRARGAYVTFVDSDDLIEPTYVETMLAAALTGDYAMVQANMIEYGQVKRSVGGYDEAGYAVLGLDDLSSVGLLGYMHSRLIPLAAIGELRFPENVGFCEDTLFLVQFMAADPGRKILAIDAAEYEYRSGRVGSITVSASVETHLSRLTAADVVSQVFAGRPNERIADEYREECYGGVFVELVKARDPRYEELTARVRAEVVRLRALGFRPGSRNLRLWEFCCLHGLAWFPKLLSRAKHALTGR